MGWGEGGGRLAWLVSAGEFREGLLEMVKAEPRIKDADEYIKAVYCHPASLTYMQSTS